MIQYNGEIYCEHCDWRLDNVPDGWAWHLVRLHVEDNPGHQVTYEISVKAVSKEDLAKLEARDAV